MNSFMCYFSKLEHIAHFKAKNQNIVKTNFCTHARTHTHTHTQSQYNSLNWWYFKDDVKDASFFNDPTLQGRLFQTDGPA